MTASPVAEFAAFPRLAARAFGKPLYLSQAGAAALEPALVAHLIEGRPATRMGVVGEQDFYGVDSEGWPVKLKTLVRRQGRIGIIPVEGTLVHKGAWIGTHCGMTSYQGLQSQIIEAASDESIAAVAFEIDSFGGEVSGCADTARMIRELSAVKPTIAILSDVAFSAGYYLASQCRAVTLPECGGAGSIGALSMHLDVSGAMEKTGMRVTVIAAGAHKADGHPYAAIPEPVLAARLAELERVRAIFARDVAAGRGDRMDVAAAMATEANIYWGEAAIAAGLADEIASPLEAFATFAEAFG